jgi:murein DD-endopeptidase MepM/ murein hydrolase activator NlpD
MSCVLELLRSRFWPRAAALALMTIGVAACSGEVSRFSEGTYAPRGNPETTGSIPPAQVAPAGRVESQPLPPQTMQAAPPGAPMNASTSAPTSAGIAGGGRGLASYSPTSSYSSPSPALSPSLAPARPSASVSPDITGSVATPKPASSNWSWDGGTAITVVQGDTIDGIARRYGVPASAIIQANNLSASATIQAGQQLVIPRYSNSSTSAAAPAASRTAPAKPLGGGKPATVAAASPAGNPGVHVVAQGETLSKISRLYSKPVNEIAKANNIQLTSPLKIGDRLVIPGARVTAAKPNATPIKSTPALGQPKPVAAAPKEPEAPQSASMVAPVADTPPATDGVKAAEGTGALPKFRWPANGRVIAGFGPSTNGQQNDGINIALPENTPVKAAEDGVVAYAGNELKGYGNLVLVRHPNGYVTAYAHAKELLVKRGDQVKRGQPIARSGQTGNVTAPQLHFEIRKGASPLDPMRFLNGA